MTITPEELAAYADGELTGDRRAEIERAIAQDTDLARQVDRHRALRERLSAHYGAVMDQPLPEALTAALQAKADAGADNVVSIGAARKAVPPARRKWGWAVGPALAACLALVLFTWMEPGQADGRLADTLDTQLASAQPVQGRAQVLLSFRDEAGTVCRAYQAGGEGGIACRDGDGWQIRKTVPLGTTGAGEYRQAGSDTGPLMEDVQAMAVGGTLSPEQEEALREAGWQ